jgi:hypothetical protein
MVIDGQLSEMTVECLVLKVLGVFLGQIPSFLEPGISAGESSYEVSRLYQTSVVNHASPRWPGEEIEDEAQHVDLL